MCMSRAVGGIKAEGEGERESQAGSTLTMEPDTGFSPMNLRS